MNSSGHVAAEGTLDQIVQQSPDLILEMDQSSRDMELAADPKQSVLQPPVPADIDEIEELTRKHGDWSIYVYYAQAAGRYTSLLYLAVVRVTAFAFNFPSKHLPCASIVQKLTCGQAVWLKWWSEDAGSGNGRQAMYLGVYFLLAAIALGGLSTSPG